MGREQECGALLGCRIWVGGGGGLESPPRVRPALTRQDSAPPSSARRRGQSRPRPDVLAGWAGRGAPTASREGPHSLLGDALGQLGAGGRGVGREDSVAGAGGVHSRAGSGAGSRGAESRGRGERGQQLQLPGHGPARGAVTAGPRACPRALPTAAAGRPEGAAGGGAEKPGTGGKGFTVHVPKATRGSSTTCAPRGQRRSPPGPGRDVRPLRESERRWLERPQSRHLR